MSTIDEPDPQRAVDATTPPTGVRRKDGRPASEVSVAPSPDRASADTQTERELWQGRTHFAHFSVRLGTWAALSMACALGIAVLGQRVDWLDWKAVTAAVAVTTLLTTVIILSPVVLEVYGVRYRVTSQRVFVHRGLLSQTIDQTELMRVDDVRIHKTLVDRLFGLGSVAIVSTDFSDGELRILGIAKPEALAESIRACTRSLRHRALYVENL